jgi:haloacetate dehalogenase
MDLFPGFRRERRDVNGVTINYVLGGSGTPIALLHGYPQSLTIWHKVAPALAKRHTVLALDLRGYGESSKPGAANEDHSIYCKRTCALDVIRLAETLKLGAFHVVGHDRGARVALRMALDHPTLVRSLTSLDVTPSLVAFENMDADLAFAWFHWLLMRQPYPLPETMIGNSAGPYFDFLMERWCATEGAIPPDVYAIYREQFTRPETVHSSCAEYRSVALDLEHDRADRARKLACPVLVLWGQNTKKRPGWQVGKKINMVDAWRERAAQVAGKGLDCGHFIPEEVPDQLLFELNAFLHKIETHA